MRQMALLLTVYTTPPPHTVRGLAKTLNISKPAVTRALDRLCGIDLARRKRDDADRRNVLREHLSGYLKLVWKQYYNPDVYRDAGIVEPFDVWRTYSVGDQAQEHRERVGQRRLSWLRRLELLEAA